MTLTDDAPPHHDRETTIGLLRGYGVFLVVTSAIAALSSIILTVEKIHLLENPGEDLNCDLSAFVSCGGVVNEWQASLFGFTNTIIGIVGFTVVLTLGVVLASGVNLPRWFWGGLQIGVLFGIGFITWLQSQSLYVIEVLCPYCMVVWAMMIPLFVVSTGQVLRQLAPSATVTRFVNDWRVLIISLWYIVIVALIWFKFGTTLWA